MSESGHSATGYIVHHLTNLKIGEGFWALHVDTLFFFDQSGSAIPVAVHESREIGYQRRAGAATEFLRNHGRFCRYSG